MWDTEYRLIMQWVCGFIGYEAHKNLSGCEGNIFDKGVIKVCVG